MKTIRKILRQVGHVQAIILLGLTYIFILPIFSAIFGLKKLFEGNAHLKKNSSWRSRKPLGEKDHEHQF
jgi:hypothetical protein